MKIKAIQIKPGMVIAISRDKEHKIFDDLCLVLATRGKLVKIEYTHLDYQDGYIGPLVGTIDAKEEVQIIHGALRKKVIESVKNDLFRCLNDTEKWLDMIRIIEAMDSM